MGTKVVIDLRFAGNLEEIDTNCTLDWILRDMRPRGGGFVLGIIKGEPCTIGTRDQIGTFLQFALLQSRSFFDELSQCAEGDTPSVDNGYATYGFFVPDWGDERLTKRSIDVLAHNEHSSFPNRLLLPGQFFLAEHFV